MSQTLEQIETSPVKPASAEPNFDEFAYKPIPPLAPVSALLGICALSGLLSPLGIVFAIFGSVLGYLALRQIDEADGGLSGRMIALAGVMMSVALLVVSVGLHVYWYQTEVPEGYQRISFGADISKKGFVVEEGQGRVHPDIAALEGKQLFLKGYMYPGTQLDDLSTFLLCRDNGDCCFGGQPKLTDMIKVKMTNGLKAHHMQHLVSVAGVFRLRDLRKAGNLEPAFELEATHFGLAKTSY